jgi:hypothetical protein
MEEAMFGRAGAIVMSFFLVLLGCLLLNCGGTGTSSNSAPLADQAYFAIRADRRLCPSPICGGFWVSELNQSETHCADGTVATQTTGCYVAEINSDTQGLAERTRQIGTAIVKGKILPKTFASFGNLGQLSISEGWQPITP